MRNKFNKKDYNRDWAKKNVIRVQEQKRHFNLERKLWYEELKNKYKCNICGENHPACITFHHKNAADKINEVSALAQSYSKVKVLAEIEKCIPLCANCHRIHHWQESMDKLQKERKHRFKKYERKNEGRYIITDPEGNEYKTPNGLRQFCREQGLSPFAFSAHLYKKQPYKSYAKTTGWKIRKLT